MTPGEHVCWSYADEEDLHQQVDVFVQEGVQSGERVLVGTSAGSPPALSYTGGSRSQLIQIPVPPLRRVSANGSATSWEEALRKAATGALSEGFDGVRVFLDATPLASSTQELCLRWELRLGRLVAGQPMSAVCAFRASEVDKRLISDLASVHPIIGGSSPTPPASIHLTGRKLKIEGEVDLATHHLLDLALAETEGDVVVDMSGVDFIDLRSMNRLRRFVEESREAGETVTLTGVPDVVDRYWHLVGGIW